MTIVAQTTHYQIIDYGEDWEGRFVRRFGLQRKPEFRHSRVPVEFSGACADEAGLLMDAMNKAEEFHMNNGGNRE